MKDQWIEIFTTGRHTDTSGKTFDINPEWLGQVVANYDADLHEAPAVVGHPKKDGPAKSWAKALRVNGDSLEVMFADIDPGFEEMVRAGRFKKRSASFYLDKDVAPQGKSPYLRHVGFLGASPPAVKGLRAIQFGEVDEGEAITFDISFNEGDGMEEKDVRSLGDRIMEYFKSLGKDKGAQDANFSEADLDAKIKAAVTAATASFSEEVTALKAENKKLTERADQSSGSMVRASISAFCERLGQGRFLPAFKRMGVPEFMESLAGMDQKVKISEFAEVDGKQVEKLVEISPLRFFENFLESLPPFIEFGEHFGSLVSDGKAPDMVSPQQQDDLRRAMGVKPGGNNTGGDK